MRGIDGWGRWGQNDEDMNDGGEYSNLYCFVLFSCDNV